MDPSTLLETHPIELQGTLRDQFASVLAFEALVKNLAAVDVQKLSTNHVNPSETDEQGLPLRAPLSPQMQIPKPSDLRVCIIGAGISGLYSAIILEKLGIPYDIYEASDRCGGRILTHYFSDRKNARTTHDYYDIGAMRFPDTKVMNSTFRLFDMTGITEHLVPYYMKSQTVQPFRYNDITRYYDPNRAEPKAAAPKGANGHKNGTNGTKKHVDTLADLLEEDPFEVGIKSGGCVPDDSVRNADQLMTDALGYYTAKIKRDPLQGFRYLLRHDKFSLRDYLQFVEDHDRNTIAWLETLNSGTGWFNMAFTENVLDELAFNYYMDEDLDYNASAEERARDQARRAEANQKMWKCINGGTETLIDAIFDKQLIKQPVLKNHAVVGLSQPIPGDKIAVHFVDKANRARHVQVRAYDSVINTTTLGALQRMDLSDLHLPYAYKTAIRSLRYESSSKVGIKFREPWWITRCGIKGGLGKTDLPLRVCVYPSYNIDDKGPAVLLCSYTWGQDSERIAALIDKASPQGEADLKALLLDNLARLHTPRGEDHHPLLDHITGLYMEHHAFDWSKDENAAGAFALFGPGQFQELYATLVNPVCDARFHIVGEHASAHHAWVAGALDSAARGVWNVLERFRLDDLQARMRDEFALSPEIDYDRAHLAVALGMVRREEGGEAEPRLAKKRRLQ